jgi:hypothetical protein
MQRLIQSVAVELQDPKMETALDSLNIPSAKLDASADSPMTGTVTKVEKKPRQKFAQDEQRAVGRVAWGVWKVYVLASGSYWFWTLFVFIFLLTAFGPLAENGWVGY